MRAFLLAAGILACASAPRPKTPDESHRIPINRTVPPEVASPGAARRAQPERPSAAASVEWR